MQHAAVFVVAAAAVVGVVIKSNQAFYINSTFIIACLLFNWTVGHRNTDTQRETDNDINRKRQIKWSSICRDKVPQIQISRQTETFNM